jgi:hypothetical protein
MSQTVATHPSALSHFVRVWSDRSLKEFVAAHPMPILLQHPTESDTATSFETTRLDVTVVARATKPHVFPLRKRPKNPFAHMVTVGRAENNDIVLPFGTVSKFHGYFLLESEGWSFVDAGSTNGTRVDVLRLKAKEPRRLEMHAATPIDIRFGSLRCQLFLARDFWYVLDVARASRA